MPDFERMSEILAVVGPRRAGKTFFMYQIIGDLMASGACQKDDVLFVDFEDYRLVDFTPDDTDSLFTAFNQLTGKSPKYVFFDEVQHLPSWSRVLRTLHNRGGLKIVRTIFYRDIIERYNIKAKHLLGAMMRYCLNTYSELFSISSFEKHLKASGQPGSKRTISNYLQYMAGAFFLIVNEKYSYSPRKRVMNPKKVYLLDTGFSGLPPTHLEDLNDPRYSMCQGCVEAADVKNRARARSPPQDGPQLEFRKVRISRGALLLKRRYAGTRPNTPDEVVPLVERNSTCSPPD